MRPAVILPVLLLLSASSARAQAPLDVRIGSASPLSGTGAHQGKDIENGARMAIDDLNAKAPVIGGRKVRSCNPR